MMENNIFNQRERDNKKIIIAFFFSIIMIFSAFAILNFTTTAEKSKQTINNHSLPVVSYSQFGETVSFVGSQPVISFGSTEYPTSWNILNIEQPSHLSANPLHATGNNSNSSIYISGEQFSSYNTSRIKNNVQNSANLIQYGKGIQAASVFSFHNGSVSSSIALTNRLYTNRTLMVDFTMILPESGNFTERGIGSKNIKMNNGSGIIAPLCDRISTGGLGVSWQGDRSLYHGGFIVQHRNYNILEISFGTVTLVPNETYTIDPVITPDRLPSGGSGAAYAPNSATFTVYNSNGEVAGTYTLSSDRGTEYPDCSTLSTCTSFGISFATGVSLQHSSGIWRINQEVSYGYSSGSYDGSLYIGSAKTAKQNPSNNAYLDGIIQYLFQVISNTVGFPLPDPLSFGETSSLNHDSTTPFESTCRGVVTSYSCGITICYNPIWQSYNPLSSSYGKVSYIFGVHTHNDCFNVGSLHANTLAQFYVCYGVQITFLGGSSSSPSFFEASSNMGTALNVCYV